MGYACPVCEAPQRDAEHLANHLAFTAMLHGDAHGDWLDEHAPGWADEGPADLGTRVAPLAPEATYEAVFEDTAHDHPDGRPFEGGDGPEGSGGSAGPDVPGGAVEAGRPPARRPGDAPDETTRAALAEARELTRRMRGEGEEAPQDAAGREADETGTDETGTDKTGTEAAGTDGADEKA